MSVQQRTFGLGGDCQSYPIGTATTPVSVELACLQAREKTHDLEVSFNKFAPLSEEDTANELHDIVASIEILFAQAFMSPTTA